jgi:NDP-sugar pyrophosphorylase family protein
MFRDVPDDFLLGSEFHRSVGDEPPWWLLEKLRQLLEQGHEHFIQESSSAHLVVRNSIVHPSARIDPFVFIADSYIGPSVKIGCFCQIGKSVFLAESKAGRSNYLGRSVIGARTTLSGNVRTATRRVDLEVPRLKNYDVTAPGQRMGSFIGDDVFIASTVLLNPFTFVLPESRVLPFRSVKGVIEP